MQQRYYDPTIGRFLSMDPVTADADTGGNFNRYWYANNNPYRFTDPDGRCPVCFRPSQQDIARMETQGKAQVFVDAAEKNAATQTAEIAPDSFIAEFGSGGAGGTFMGGSIQANVGTSIPFAGPAAATAYRTTGAMANLGNTSIDLQTNQVRNDQFAVGAGVDTPGWAFGLGNTKQSTSQQASANSSQTSLMLITPIATLNINYSDIYQWSGTVSGGGKGLAFSKQEVWTQDYSAKSEERK